MASVRAEAILRVAELHGNGETKPCFVYGTADHPFSGKQCVIYAVQYPDGTTCAVRVPIHIRNLSHDAITDQTEQEVFILKTLAECGFIWSPRVLAYDSGFDNPLQYPYMILSWIDGKPLEWTDSVPEKRASREKVLRQMANIFFELVSCTEEPNTGVTADIFLTDLIDRKILRVERGQLHEVSLHDCFNLRVLGRRITDKAPMISSFAISHEDLAPHNIIVDDGFNIKGLIDWGFARRLPLQFAIRFPRFLSIEPERLDDPLPRDINSFISTFLCPSSSLRTDRQYFLSQLLSTIETKLATPSIRQLAPLCLEDPDVDWKQLIFEAACSKGLHQWMAKRSWLLFGTIAWKSDPIIPEDVPNKELDSTT